MAISSKQGSGKKPKYIIKEVVVDSIQTEFNTTTNNGKNVDISLIVNYTAEKQDKTTYEAKHFVDGNFKRERGKVTGKGSAFKIIDLLDVLDPEEFVIPDDGKIAPEVFTKREGKTFLLLRYISQKEDSGETIYRDFKGYAKTASDLETKFLNQVNGNYPPYKYMPELSETAEEAKPYNYEESTDDENEPPF